MTGFSTGKSVGSTGFDLADIPAGIGRSGATFAPRTSTTVEKAVADALKASSDQITGIGQQPKLGLSGSVSHALEDALREQSRVEKALGGGAFGSTRHLASFDTTPTISRAIADAAMGTTPFSVAGSRPFAASGALQDAIDKISKPIGIADDNTGTVGKALAKFNASNDRMRDMLDMIERADRHDRAIFFEPAQLPSMPPNPLHETNDHLEALAEQIAQMRELTAGSAEAQQRQTELVAAILAKVIEESAAAGKAGRRNLLIALAGVLVGAAGAVLSLF